MSAESEENERLALAKWERREAIPPLVEEVSVEAGRSDVVNADEIIHERHEERTYFRLHEVVRQGGAPLCTTNLTSPASPTQCPYLVTGNG